MLLSVEGLNYFYGEAIHALRDVSFGVAEGEIVSIIGANGAGKSTLMWTLIGVLKPKSGTITFSGQPIRPIPHLAVAAGIALVPERRRLFANLTVRENLSLGGYLRNDRAGIARDEDYIFSLFPDAQGAAQAVRRHAFGRGAADGGHRPGADVSPQAAAAGRALVGPGAGPGQPGVRHGPGNRRAREPRSCWSSRTRSRRWRSPSAPMCWRSDGSSCRARGKNSCTTRRSRRPTWASARRPK